MAEKRGRKRKNDLYFGPPEEEAVVKYLSLGELIQHPDHPEDANRLIWVGTKEEEIERAKIYRVHLKDPLNKMVESIIRRYKLYRKSYSFEELHSDTLSFLMIKTHKFDITAGKKAYSYYGTICKNYILALLIKDDKNLKQNSSFEDTFSRIQERDDLTYHLPDTDYVLAEFITNISDEIKDELYDNEDEPKTKKKITENERRVGEALIDILDNWEAVFDSMEGGTKYNKNAVLHTIRENTGLTTKDIRVAMRRFKKLYYFIKDDKIDEGYL